MKHRTLTMCVGQMLPAGMNIDHPALQSKLGALEKLLNYLEAHAPYEEQPRGWHKPWPERPSFEHVMY